MKKLVDVCQCLEIDRTVYLTGNNKCDNRLNFELFFGT